MNILVIASLFLLVSVRAFSQPNIQSIHYYDGHNDYDNIYDVFRATGNKLAMCGVTATDTSGWGFWLIYASNNGEALWQRTYFSEDNPTGDIAYSLVQLEDEGFVLGGRSGEAGRLPINFSVLRVNPDGDRIWWNIYNGQHSNLGNCRAVIETKEGNILCTGEAVINNSDRAYAVLVNLDGEVIWERYYGQRGRFYAVREVEDVGFLFAGHDMSNNDGGWLLMANSRGDEIWSHNFATANKGLVSSPRGGYGAPGLSRNGWSLLKVNRGGDELFSSIYDMHNDDIYKNCSSIASMIDGGFALAGIASTNNPCVLRTDAQGNEMWRSIYHFGFQENINEEFNAIITGEDDRILVAGKAYPDQNRSYDGVLVIINPEDSRPKIIRWSPVALNIKHLSGEDQIFRVWAEDIQRDSLRYIWTINGDSISNRNPIRRAFDEIGEYSIKCIVSDSLPGDSVSWTLTVTDLYIQSFTPDTLNLSIRRGASVDFAIDSVAAVGGNDDVQFLWTKTNLDNPQPEETGRDARATIPFLQSGHYAVEGLAYRGESHDEVVWNVTVSGAIWSFAPVDITLEVLPDSLVRFEVVPSEPDSVGGSITWLVDGEVARFDETVLEWRFFGEADSCPPHLVQVVVADSVEADTVTWEVTVRELGIIGDEEAGRPGRPVLLNVSPNPFNSTLVIRFDVGARHAVPLQLAIYDVSGREVARLVDGGSSVNPPWLTERNSADRRGSAEETSSATWNASLVPAGVYLVRLQTGQEVSTKKVVLIR